jgi:Zn-finger nucleic acid-binding protein
MDKKIHCPRCSGIWNKRFMRKVKHQSGAILDVCHNCGGMWLDKDEVRMLYDYSKKSRGKKK